jgi:DNA-binding transcriptional MerR regulator
VIRLQLAACSLPLSAKRHNVTLDNVTELSHYASVTETRYAIGDLADLGGVSRRTVRYYVQEGLLPAPLGVGRGNHYTQDHLDRLLQVKALQEAGRSLDEIRGLLEGQGAAVADVPRPAAPLSRTVWRHLTLAPGVELHVSSAVRLPPPGRLQALADWCRHHCIPTEDKSEDDDA